ncbi:MAG: polysaccharide biosynthesis C-terminal domain-containing protein, partial [Clostridia bacterium]|nr:polysaccharide biosynthesis C-terminal domain-containing protein [Clostridia bacterium]
VRILGGYVSDTVGLYGLYSGTAMTVVNLPVSVCYGLAVVAVPLIAGKRGGREKNARFLIVSTVVLSVLGAGAVFLFSPLAVKILFPRLTSDDSLLTLRLIRALLPTVVTLSVLQTENSILIASGKTFVAVINAGVGICAKVITSAILLKNPTLNIFASVIGVNLCYLLATVLNLVYIKIYAVKTDKNRDRRNGE